MSEPELFFISEAIRHAKSLPLGDAMTFLDGMITTVGTGHVAHDFFVAARKHFDNGDAQLELLASGQLKFVELLK